MIAKHGYRIAHILDRFGKALHTSPAPGRHGDTGPDTILA
jgi:hypothetical protein